MQVITQTSFLTSSIKIVYSALLITSSLIACAEPAKILPSSPEGKKIVDSARKQIGVTISYDPAYVGLKYPMGDVPRETGVCADVVVRALRDGLGADLQKNIHEDMKSNFSAYPKKWGLKSTDKNIDHRRVPNIDTYLSRRGYSINVSQVGADYKAGDIVSVKIPDGRPHIMIVSDRAVANGTRPLIIHNIGRGVQEEDRLFEFNIVGHYRIKPNH